ncbi:Sec-independent protein translocase protein TatB [Hoeflea sp. 108]|uniref:Sec-independent protein translocase protein TatB n=1 Tax=Hoeflea sp. 108 TaxID=1116369 RepID=UPI000380F7EF|nr:Sec-independent protein translocase protein TatB [Hoeflea sp. 108]
MFEIGWTEMLVIAIVMIVVVGPKDLPRMLRTMGRMTAKARSMASDFQRQFNEALKEAELDDVKKSVDELRGLNPVNEIKRQLNPFEQAAADVRAGIDSAMKPTQPAPPPPADDAVHAAEPLKNGATAMPGVAGPEAMPAPPVFPAPETRSTPVPAAAAPAAAEAAKSTKPKAPAKAKSAAKPAAEAKPAAKTKTVAAVAKSAPAPKAAAAKAAAAKATVAKAPAAKAAAKKTTKAGRAS